MRASDQRGFTIMELLVAMAFLGVVLVSLTELFTGLRQINRAANNYTIANQVAQQLMEKYRNTPYNTITTGTTDVTTSALSAYPSLLTPRSATTTVNWINESGVVQGADSGLKRVDVAISYKERTGIRNVQYSTQISNKGINK